MTAPMFAPMLAGYGRPAGRLEGWAAEVKVDGWRAQLAIDSELPGGLRVRTRAGRAITDRLAELAPLADFPCSLVLDGELIAKAGRSTDFYALAPALWSRRRREALTFVAFDLLWLDGHDCTALPNTARRKLLVELELPEPIVVGPAFDGPDVDPLLASDACNVSKCRPRRVGS